MEKEIMAPEIVKICKEIIEAEIKILKVEIKNLEFKIKEQIETAVKYKVSDDKKNFGESIEEIREVIQEKENEIERLTKSDPEKMAENLATLKSYSVSKLDKSLSKNKYLLTITEEQEETLSAEDKVILNDINEKIFNDVLSLLGLNPSEANKPKNQKLIEQKINELKASEIKKIDENLVKNKQLADMSIEDYAKYQLSLRKKELVDVIGRRREISLVQAMGGQAFYDVDNSVSKAVVSLDKEQVSTITRLPENQFNRMLSYFNENNKIKKKVIGVNDNKSKVYRKLIEMGSFFGGGAALLIIGTAMPYSVSNDPVLLKNALQLSGAGSMALSFVDVFEVFRLTFAESKRVIRKEVEKYLKQAQFESVSAEREQ